MPRYTVTVRDREYDIMLVYRSDHVEATIDGKHRHIVVHNLHDTRWLLLIDNQSLEVDVRSNGSPAVTGERMVFLRGHDIPVIVEDHALAHMRKVAGIGSAVKTELHFKAPMPGLVVQIRVEPGQQVNVGEPLVVIEAMKMENVLKARVSGKVRTVAVAVGQSVEKGDTLVEFE
jgi:acetyl/propionyl-CoA carboxylase alpha subunit